MGQFQDITIERGDTLQVRLPGGELLTVYAAPSGFQPLVQVTLPVSDAHRLIVEQRSPEPVQQECGFIRMYERSN